MRRLILMLLVGTAMTVQAEEMDTLKSVELQDVQVVSVRATKKRQRTVEGSQLWSGRALLVVADSLGDDDE